MSEPRSASSSIPDNDGGTRTDPEVPSATVYSLDGTADRVPSATVGLIDQIRRFLASQQPDPIQPFKAPDDPPRTIGWYRRNGTPTGLPDDEG